MGDGVRMIPSTSYKSLRYVNMNNEDVNQGGLITINTSLFTQTFESEFTGNRRMKCHFAC